MRFFCLTIVVDFAIFRFNISSEPRQGCSLAPALTRTKERSHGPGYREVYCKRDATARHPEADGIAAAGKASAAAPTATDAYRRWNWGCGAHSHRVVAFPPCERHSG